MIEPMYPDDETPDENRERLFDEWREIVSQENEDDTPAPTCPFLVRDTASPPEDVAYHACRNYYGWR